MQAVVLRYRHLHIKFCQCSVLMQQRIYGAVTLSKDRNNDVMHQMHAVLRYRHFVIHSLDACAYRACAHQEEYAHGYTLNDKLDSDRMSRIDQKLVWDAAAASKLSNNAIYKLLTDVERSKLYLP